MFLEMLVHPKRTCQPPRLRLARSLRGGLGVGKCVWGSTSISDIAAVCCLLTIVIDGRTTPSHGIFQPLTGGFTVSAYGRIARQTATFIYMFKNIDIPIQPFIFI